MRRQHCFLFSECSSGFLLFARALIGLSALRASAHRAFCSSRQRSSPQRLRPSVRSRHVKALRRFTVRAHLPDRLAALERLSVNLRWSWDKPTQDLFATIDPELWAQVGPDPVALLGGVSPK